MEDKKFFDFILKSDDRIDTAFTTFDTVEYIWSVKIKIKPPFQTCSVKLDISKIELEDSPTAESHYKILIARTIDEAIAKFSHYVIKQYEIVQLEKQKAELEKLNTQLEKAIVKEEKIKSGLLQGTWGNIDSVTVDSIYESVKFNENKYQQYLETYGLNKQKSNNMAFGKKTGKSNLSDILEKLYQKAIKSEIQPPKAKNYTTHSKGGFDQGVVDELAKIFPALKTEYVNCPLLVSDGCSFTNTIGDVIVHVNDQHEWTREAIADWLETLKVKLEVKEGK